MSTEFEVTCVKPLGGHLTEGKNYKVLRETKDSYRVLDDSEGENFFPKGWFAVVVEFSKEEFEVVCTTDVVFGVTKGKSYHLVDEDDHHYKLIDNTKVGRWYGKEHFQKVRPVVDRSIEEGFDTHKVAVKHDNNKIRMELLSVVALEEIAKVMTFGAKKYDDHNWRKGFKWSRLLGACLRHVLAFMRGEDKDPETGLSHLAHAGCCIMFLLEHEARHLGEDDRYKEDKNQ